MNDAPKWPTVSPEAFAIETTRCDSCGETTIHLMVREGELALDVALELTAAERVIRLLRSALVKPPILATHGSVLALPNWQPGNPGGTE